MGIDGDSAPASFLLPTRPTTLSSVQLQLSSECKARALVWHAFCVATIGFPTFQHKLFHNSLWSGALRLTEQGISSGWGAAAAQQPAGRAHPSAAHQDPVGGALNITAGDAQRPLRLLPCEAHGCESFQRRRVQPAPTAWPLGSPCAQAPRALGSSLAARLATAAVEPRRCAQHVACRASCTPQAASAAAVVLCCEIHHGRRPRRALLPPLLLRKTAA